MEVGAFAGCVKLYAQTISTLPFGMFEKQADGQRKERDDHPLYSLLHDAPNADQDAAEWWESFIAWWVSMGNAYAEKILDNGDKGRLVALDLLNAKYTSPRRRSDGAREFVYRYPGKEERVIPEERMFHLRGMTFGADMGLSTVELGRQTLGTTRATERAGAAHFANGMRPSGWLVYKGGTLEDNQRELARQNLINPMVGAGNAGKIGILEGEFDYRQMTITPEAAQLLDSRRFNVEDVCRLFGVPPILLSHASQGQTMWGTGIEQILLGWVVLQVRPRLVRVERAIAKQLQTPADRRTFYPEFGVEGLLRGDSAARAELYWKLFQVGAVNPHWIQDKENLPHSPGGDRYYVNQTMAPLDETGIPIKAQAPDQTNSQDGADLNPPPQRRLEVVK
jgi:HK97 family phage portal protein